MPRTRYIDDADRIRRNVEIDPETGCWNWQLCLKENGYGRVNVGGKLWHSHRLAYEAFIGEIPDGLDLDHLCRNRACCNPEHLEPVTARENHHRSPVSNASKTHCPANHPYTPENVYWARGGTARRCRICTREATKRSKIRRALRAAGIEVAA
jgi:hypothetical protein